MFATARGNSSAAEPFVTDMTKTVRFDRFGGIDVLEVRDVEPPSAGPGEVLVEVRAAGINPGEATIRKGLMHDVFPTTFPSGQGSDMAGVVAEARLRRRHRSRRRRRGHRIHRPPGQPRRVRGCARRPTDGQARRGVRGRWPAPCTSQAPLHTPRSARSRLAPGTRWPSRARRAGSAHRGPTRQTRRRHRPRHRRAVER